MSNGVNNFLCSICYTHTNVPKSSWWLSCSLRWAFAWILLICTKIYDNLFLTFVKQKKIWDSENVSTLNIGMKNELFKAWYRNKNLFFAHFGFCLLSYIKFLKGPMHNIKLIWWLIKNALHCKFDFIFNLSPLSTLQKCHLFSHSIWHRIFIVVFLKKVGWRKKNPFS